VKALLFDIDGTLLLSGGAGNRAMDRTFRTLCGIAEATKGRDFSGMTDPVILRDIFRHLCRREVTSAELEELKATYLRFLEEEIQVSPAFQVLPGVNRLLSYLSQRSDLLLGVATGNLERGAMIKLKRAQLHPYFSFGAYGSDSEDRAEIVALARERARRLADGDPGHLVAFVIGDTPLDIEAGRAAGCLTVAVASGTRSQGELQAYNPTYLLPDLTRLDKFLALLSSP